APPVPLYRPRRVQRKGVQPPGVQQARIERDGVAGTPEAVALTQQVPDRYAFDPSPEARGQPANLRQRPAKAAAEQVLVAYRHYLFAARAAERGHAVGICRVEEIHAREVQFA